jgi:hypothetical protein
MMFHDVLRPFGGFRMIKNGVLREPNSRLDGPKMVLHSMQCGMKFFKTKDCAKLLCKLRFYALIPHNFGLKAPPPINNQELLQRLVPLHYIVEICRTLSHKFFQKDQFGRSLNETLYGGFLKIELT